MSTNRIVQFAEKVARFPRIGNRNSAIGEMLENLRTNGRRPYFVSYGVSNGLGAAAYTTANPEIARQSAILGFNPAAIVHASDSVGTRAGLVVGASQCLRDMRVVPLQTSGCRRR